MATGKWIVEGVPHKGWTCDMVTDLEEDRMVCAMCEIAEIRYVHTMRHPDYPDPLGVGCVCAEHMEEDYVGPRLRENRLRARARRLRSWDRRIWYRGGWLGRGSAGLDGTWYLNTEGFHLSVRPVGGMWQIYVQHRQSGCEQYGRLRFPDHKTAQRAALDALQWAKGHLSQRGHQGRRGR
jgi:hypothetical protein